MVILSLDHTYLLLVVIIIYGNTITKIPHYKPLFSI